MITQYINKPATLHTWTKLPDKDEAGDVQHDFTDSAVLVELQQKSATELRDGMLIRVDSWTVFLRPDTTVTGLDELTVDGARYTFNGDPWLVRNPRTGAESHWQGRMEKVS